MPAQWLLIGIDSFPTSCLYDSNRFKSHGNIKEFDERVMTIYFDLNQKEFLESR